MGSQITLTISLVMITLFSVAIIGYSMGFATDNDAFHSISDDPEISALNVSARGGLDSFRDDSQSTYSSITNSTVSPGSDVLQSTKPITITWSNVFSIATNMITVGYEKIFGEGGSFGIFLTALLGVIGFMIALYVIKTWRGDP